MKTEQLRPYTLTNNEEISPGVHLISFLRLFDFIPGQVVKVALQPKEIPRIYSICSGNHEDEISILFNIKEDGMLTPRLAASVPGEKIWVSSPYGSFTGSPDPAWWIAAGTGIAPFYSMFCSGQGGNKKLIHGVKYLSQFYFNDEWEWALEESYVRCCSRESSCDTFPGRVTDYLSEEKEFPDINYYICGKALMVVEVRDLLIAKGVPFKRIFSEIYF